MGAFLVEKRQMHFLLEGFWVFFVETGQICFFWGVYRGSGKGLLFVVFFLWFLVVFGGLFVFEVFFVFVCVFLGG